MPDLSVDCPKCGTANAISVASDAEVFTCTHCGVESSLDAAAMTGAAPQQDYLVDEVISDCKIIKKVGEGGFGSVYKAHDQNLQRTVAFKVMLQSLTTNAEFVQKFIREAVTAAQLNHPNIVSIHKVGRDEKRGIHYLIMEFVEGRTLADIVTEKGVLTAAEALPIFIQSCDALATAHEHAIVHRDIKPENLMLTTQGVVKITDFGLAKSLSSDQKTTKVMGTPHYMSPEQFEGKAVDGRSDIYSLGVTFYYLLSQTRPYEGQNTVQIIYSILTQAPKPLTEANKDIPAGFWAVIQKMIEKKVEDRYQTLRDTIQDLRKLQATTGEDRSGCAQCGTKNPKGRKFCRSCGSALVVACPACGSQEPAGARQCSACGADVDNLLRVKKCLEAAKRFQALGDLRRAAEGYRQVLQFDPKNAEANAEIAKLNSALAEVEKVSHETQELMKTGAIEDALSGVEELLRRYPSATEVRQQRDDLRQALADRKVNRLVEAAERAAAEGRLREAMESLDQALRTDSGREDVLALRTELGRRVALAAESRQKAAEALAAGRYEEAFQLASEVLKVQPGDAAMEDVRSKARASVESVDQFVARGQQKLAAKRYADALAEFEAALALRPSDGKLLQQVEAVRARMTEQRDRIAQARRLLADRQFASASALVKTLVEECPEDLEVRSLKASSDRAAQDAQRHEAIEGALQEAGRLESAGDFDGAFAQLERVAVLDPENEVAKTRRDQIERRMREAKALRELADEHLSDGLFGEAVEALSRLRTVNPARAAEIDKEIEDARAKDARTKGAMDRAEKALSAREYRRAAEAAGQVLALAARHPRAAAVKKDAEKAVAAIDRFLQECDRLLASELFDEALEALDKAKERGATAEEYKHRREACDQGRLALLKTDATRSIVMKDFDAAIAAYEHVLETRKDDPEALAGKRAAERRVRILTTEPLGLRMGAAAAVLLVLGLVQFSAVAATRESRAEVVVKTTVEQAEAAKVKLDTVKKEANYGPANDAEAASDWSVAAQAYAAEAKEFPEDARLRNGIAFAEAYRACLAETDPMRRLDGVVACEALLGDVTALRTVREAALVKVRDAAIAERLAAIAKTELVSADEAIASYGALRDHPGTRGSTAAADRIDAVSYYLDVVQGGEQLERLTPPQYARAADSYFRAKRAIASDPERAKGVQDHLDRLRGRWLEDVRKRASAIAAGDDTAYYREVVVELAEMSRTLGIDRAGIEREFSEGR